MSFMIRSACRAASFLKHSHPSSRRRLQGSRGLVQLASVSQDKDARHEVAVLAVTTVLVGGAVAGLALSQNQGGEYPVEISSCEPLRSVLAQQQPRNVMLHRMRSARGRGLNDKYKVEWKTVLGEGAYGSVHPARLATTGEKVALKKISRHYTTSSAFKTETDALLRIFDNGGHPNISGLRDMYEDHNYYYLILDLVSGGEMFEHLIHYGAYSEADAARLMYEVASALAFLHGVGVVHADLKPENLLLSTKNRLDGTIKLIDFGCATLLDMDHETENASQTEVKEAAKTASSTGTTAYWPKERFESGVFATPGECYRAPYDLSNWYLLRLFSKLGRSHGCLECRRHPLYYVDRCPSFRYRWAIDGRGNRASNHDESVPTSR